MRRLLFLAFVLSCSNGSSGVNSTQQAEEAYNGLDESIDKAITLGFKGYNASNNANIPTETANGDISGTMSVNGTVDQGVSANKQMHLQETLDDYSDTDAGIVYWTDGDAGTDGAPAALVMGLQNIPTTTSGNGTLNGSLDGTYGMTGKLQGLVTLSVTFSGKIDRNDAGLVERTLGTTTITGTATSGSGVYNINVTH